MPAAASLILAALASAGAAEPPVAAEPAAFEPSAKSRWVKLTNHEADPATPAPSKPASPAITPIASANPPTAAGGTPSFAKQLAMLEVRLSRRIAEPPNLWRLDDIEAEASRLLNAASDEPQRQAVRGIATRVQRFDALAERHRELSAGLPSTLDAATVVGLGRQTPAIRGDAGTYGAAQSNAAPSNAAQYDAVGELRPVVSKRPGAPKYAIVGRDGKVVTFVTPAEGMDLDPLLGKQVGARGGRGYMPEYKHRHLTAQKITPLPPLRR
ncbi:MAG: hypothetical protein AAGG46_03130 [Planctomycetota bacterium]